MSIESIPEVNLDEREQSNIVSQISQFEKAEQPLIMIHSSIEHLEKVSSTLCVLRAANISALLFLKKGECILKDQEILTVFEFLRERDQLTLHNFLEICDGWIPQTFLPPLQAESKIELKWFKEWLSASTDSKIHRYPTLPWRSFIRKIVEENYEFVTRFFELIARPAITENVQAVQHHLSTFLEAKRKVLCIFPKRWNKPTH